jgi:hypothetical protein
MRRRRGREGEKERENLMRSPREEHTSTQKEKKKK